MKNKNNDQFKAGDNYPILMGNMNGGDLFDVMVSLIDGEKLQDKNLTSIGKFSEWDEDLKDKILANTGEEDANYIETGEVFYYEEEDEDSRCYIILYGDGRIIIDKKIDGYDYAIISENNESYFVDLGTGLGEAEYPKSDFTLDEAIEDQVNMKLE